MAIPLLPQEIVEEHIIDKLTNDPKALRACALVCRAWIPTAQSRLFSSINLRFLENGSRELDCVKLRRVFATSAHLAPYVSTLLITDGPESNLRWLANNRESLSSILPMLVNVKKITISFVSLPWAQAEPLRDIFRQLFRHHLIQSIELRGLSSLPGWDQLFYMLNGCRADHVLLYAVTLDPSSRMARRRRGQAIQRPRSTIRRLETNSSIEDMEDLAFWADNPKACLDISSLGTFTFDLMRVADIAGCNAVLQAQAFSGLQAFEIVVDNIASFRDGVTAQLDLSRLRHLQLTVRDIPFASHELCNLLRWFAHVFRNSGSQSIEEVTLTCVQWVRARENVEDQLAWWRDVDAALCLMPNLSLVQLKTESEFKEDLVNGAAFLQARKGEMFPVLIQRGNLRQL